MVDSFPYFFDSWKNMLDEKLFLLNLINSLVSSHCGAIFDAFFSFEQKDLSEISSEKKFINIPTIKLNQKEDKKAKKLASFYFPNYSIISEYLPKSSHYIQTMFDYIQNLYENCVTLSSELMDLLLDIILKIASLNTEMTNQFCFSPGKYIYQITNQLLDQETDASKEFKTIRSFAITMKEILVLQTSNI